MLHDGLFKKITVILNAHSSLH